MTTPLDTFLTASKISDAEFGALIDKDRTTVNRIRNGKVRPTLEVAALIETHTGGAVKMQVWTSLSVASCGVCERRAEDPACDACVRADCGLRQREAA
jgi:DNA-binding XRE family transcriptional regulator